MVEPQAIRDAAAALSGVAVRTPLLYVEPLDAYLKLENLQPMGAFKIRGAYNAIRRLPAGARARGVTYSTHRSLATNASVNALLAREIEQANALLGRVEQVKAFRILDRELDPEIEGEAVTATRKIKRALLQRQFVVGQQIMLARVLLRKGCIVPEHSHHNEQLTYIVEGALKFYIDGKEIVVHAGEVLCIPSNMPHKAEAIEDTVDLDIFAPPRADWINKTDQYLRGEK